MRARLMSDELEDLRAQCEALRQTVAKHDDEMQKMRNLMAQAGRLIDQKSAEVFRANAIIKSYRKMIYDAMCACVEVEKEIGKTKWETVFTRVQLHKFSSIISKVRVSLARHDENNS